MAPDARREPDAGTVARLRSGDIAALEAVFEVLSGAVIRLSRSLMGNSTDAEDAAQEIFLHVYEQAGKFDGQARFSTWVYRLAVRYCLNKVRQRRRRAAAEKAAVAQRIRLVTAEPGKLPATKDESARAAALLERLPPSYRACLVLREIEGRSYAEIAELLDIPPGTVMSRLSRARRLLAAMLDEPAEK
ncbi:MAG: RNA polymerase sigma factor [Phycisphaerae bacterium]|nr:RNA polymerase sigma factor [Phycisphaerae bacterium]